MDIKNLLKKRWTILALIIIIMLGFYARSMDYRWPYLRNIDSYAFYRQVDEIIINGGVAPTYDNLLLAPQGAPRTPELFPYQYITAYSFMITKLFVPGIQLWQFLIGFPALLASLAAIPMYFIGKYLYSRKAGIIAALLTVFDMSLFSRSLAGDPDNDGFVLLIALIVMAMFLITYNHINKNKKFDKKAIMYTILTGVFLGIWNQTWIGYWYLIWMITGFIIIKILLEFTKTKNILEAIKLYKHTIASFAAALLILILFFQLPFANYGIQRVAYTFTGPIEFQSIKSEDAEFPNVYVSVAELQSPGNIKDIIQRTSTVNFDQNPLAMLISPFFFMIYCLIYLIYAYVKRKEHSDALILLAIWFIGPLLATLVATRFSILFVAPIAIGVGIIMSKIIDEGIKNGN